MATISGRSARTLAGAQFTVDLTGDEEFAATLRAVNPAKNPEVIRRSLKRWAEETQAEMRDNVSGPRPRFLDVVTGSLRRSITFDKVREKDGRVEVGVHALKWWAEIHELGQGRARARPFMLPAVKKTEKRIVPIMLREWDRQGEKSNRRLRSQIGRRRV